MSAGINGQEATKNNDLRKHFNLFLIKDMQSKEQITYKMSSSKSGQFNFTMESGQNILNKKKINSVDAQKMDDLFVDKFISFKYLMKEKSKKKCPELFYLNLRGEELIICKDEREKIVEMKALIEKMKVVF